MTIEWVDILSLKPNLKNPNKHSTEQIDRLAEIITYQGWRHPIIIDKDNVIWAGHGRLMAARKLGLQKVPVHVQEFQSEEQAYAFLVSDNAIASWAELDLANVNAQMASLGPDFDVNLLGIKDFVLEPADKYQGDEDAVPEPNPIAYVASGDLYLCGNHRVLCGDSTRTEDVQRLMNGEKADMVFTSPPYNQSLNLFTASGMQKENPNWVNKMASSYFDSMPEADYQMSQIKLLKILYEYTSPIASIFYNHKNRYRNKQVISPLDWIRQYSWVLRQEIIWNRKGSITLNASR